MRTSRQITAALGSTLAALVLAVAPAAAQDTPSGVQPYRFTVEGYLANYWFDRGGSLDRASVGGYGLRAMFNRSDASKVARTFFDRASVGAYATFTSKQDRVSTQNLGGQVDIALFPMPVARGLLDPFVSVGAGVLRSKTDAAVVGRSTTETNFVLTPAAGTRIPFFSGIGFRGDLRVPIEFGDDTRAHFLAEGGLYVSF